MEQLSPLERIENYRRRMKMPAHLHYEDGWLTGTWFLGFRYKKANDYYGGYQGNLLKRIDAVWPDRQRTLHLFAGKVDTALFPGDTLDIRTDLNPPPTWCINAETCQAVPLESYDFILADPPYSKEHAKKYGTRLPDSSKVMAAIGNGVRPGTRLLWLDWDRPTNRGPQHAYPQWRLDTAITIIGSCNHHVRILFGFIRLPL